MYMFSYAESIQSTYEAREQENKAFSHVIGMLEQAAGQDTNSAQSLEALVMLRRLWTVLIEELSSADSDLPEQLRADLISIGLYVLKESDRIRRGESDNLASLIEINSIIRDGLK